MSLTNTLSYIIIYIGVSFDYNRLARPDVIPAGCPSGCPSPLGSILHPDHMQRARRSIPSAAEVSFENRSCRESLIDSVALIINYLGVPLGMYFTGRYDS